MDTKTKSKIEEQAAVVTHSVLGIAGLTPELLRKGLKRDHDQGCVHPALKHLLSTIKPHNLNQKGNV
jgi:hypothetical protein